MRLQWQTRRFYPDLYGGLEVRGYRLVCAWQDMGHAVSVLCENRPVGPAVREEPISGVDCLRMPCGTGGPLWRLAPLLRTARWARWQRKAAPADVTVAAYPESAVSSRLTRPERAILYNCVNVAPPPHAGPAERFAIDQRRWLIRKAAEWADKVVVASQCLRRQLAAWAPKAAEKIAVVPHGADIDRFAAARPNPTLAALHERGLVPIIYLGRLSREKGVDLAIEAFARLRHRRRAALVLVGDGPAEPELRQQAFGAGLGEQVIFAGRTDAPEQALAGAAMLVLPSRVEAFGTVLVEAMAAGVPCVSWAGGSADLPMAADEIIVQGQTGLCAPAFETAALAECIDALIENVPRRRQMGATAQALARRRYSFEQMARSYAELAADALSERSRRRARRLGTPTEAATP